MSRSKSWTYSISERGGRLHWNREIPTAAPVPNETEN